MKQQTIFSMLWTICKWVFLIAAAIIIVPVMFCIELAKRH